MPLQVKSITPSGNGAIELGKLNILVGPNNCGKSQTLKDIRDYVISGSLERLVILRNLDVEVPSKDESILGLSFLPHQNLTHTRILGVNSDLQTRHEIALPNGWVEQQYSEMGSDSPKNLLSSMGKFWCSSLDAEGRFRLSAPVDSYDKRSEVPSNALQAFYREGKPALQKLRNAFRAAFDTDIAIDWAAMRKLYLKIGRDFGEIPDTLDGVDNLLREAQDLSTQGDGYRSFAGIALAVLAFPMRLLLLDEPEAFLHPAQARALGRWVAQQTIERQAQVIVASHSADFLLGAVSAGTSVTLLRLNRRTDGTTFQCVPPTTTVELIQSPLLSSQPVLDALFHRGVVVCEGDPDRAVYQTVLHRFFRDAGGEEVLLIHSNGKDAIKTPVETLRLAGTPVCVIADIDILNSQSTLEATLLALTGGVPSARILELRSLIATSVEKATETDILESIETSVRQWLEMKHIDLRTARKTLVSSARIKSKWDDVKRKGVSYFDGDSRKQIDELLSLLGESGMFVVPCGELEGWICSDIAKGARWNRAALEMLHSGQCPTDLKCFMQAVLNFVSPSFGASKQLQPTNDEATGRSKPDNDAHAQYGLVGEG
ncbi:ATP-dependent nuclease [Burkholderia gladioli]|uniref:ATP-dependent nuclease n=1 Tax=Burkholderia gladioli TaxID=28095 RepID=UPI00163E4A4C|nr:AAA family ATPase [Burkholderia gladioli]